MEDVNLKLQIQNLQMLIELEEENYKTALQHQTEFTILQRLRENIKKLKFDLQILIDKRAVQKTGELPQDKNLKDDGLTGI